MAIDTDLHSLVINELTKAQYDELAAQGLINENELYIVTDAETAITIKEGGALSGDGTSANPLDISEEFKTQLSGDLEEITNKITQEVSDRQSADEGLQQNINSETQTRQEEDTKLQQAITSEENTRKSEIARVEKSLSDKATELSNTITTESTRLEGLVTAETEARTAKDTEIASNLSQEISQRKSEITRVEGLITTEANTRAEEDEKLTELVNTEVQNLKNTKQDNLSAGTNIEIVDNTVSTIATQIIRRRW